MGRPAQSNFTFNSLFRLLPPAKDKYLTRMDIVLSSSIISSSGLVSTIPADEGPSPALINEVSGTQSAEIEAP